MIDNFILISLLHTSGDRGVGLFEVPPLLSSYFLKHEMAQIVTFIRCQTESVGRRKHENDQRTVQRTYIVTRVCDTRLIIIINKFTRTTMHIITVEHTIRINCSD